MVKVVLAPSFGLITNDNPGNGATDIHPSNGDSTRASVDSDRDKKQEVIEDICDICSYFGNRIQRVKWCTWEEDKKTYTALLCKPCYTSLEKIGR